MYEYEHSALHKWSKDLARSLFDVNDSKEVESQSLINKCFFYVSDDVGQDGIAFIKGRGLCELEDMVLEPVQVLHAGHARCCKLLRAS